MRAIDMKCGPDRKVWAVAVSSAVAVLMGLAAPAAAAEASSTTVQSTPTSVVAGNTVTLSALVSCPADPSGGLGMTFFDGGDILATVPVAPDGSSTYTVTFTRVGAHTITAAYNGNDDCNASSDITTVQVSQSVPQPPSGGDFPKLSFVQNIHIENNGNEINNGGRRTLR